MPSFPRASSSAPRGIVFFLAVLLAGCDPMGLVSLFDRPATGTSVLTLLDTDGRELEIGDEVTGALSGADFVGLNESYLEAWALVGETGQTFSIDLLSEDFDSYLYVVGPGLTETLRDDDSGGACHSRLSFTVLEPGIFHVVASSSSGRQSGMYRLRVSESDGPRAQISCGGIDGVALTSMPSEGWIPRNGSSVFGSLTGDETMVENGRPVRAWTVEGTAGETVTIHLESDDYDAFLYLMGPGLNETLTDDDGGVGLNSALTVTFPQTGEYTVGAGALSSGAVGSYTLTLRDPVDLATLDIGDRVLSLGSIHHTTLTAADPIAEGRPVQVWSFEARAGDVATFELLSDDFDSYLQVLGPGLHVPLTDDDSGEGLNSRLQVTFPADGVYRVVASPLSDGLGTYTLRVN